MGSLLWPDAWVNRWLLFGSGLIRALRPVHTPFDGDLVYAVSTAKKKLDSAWRQRDVMRLGALAADCLARAIARGVYEAESK